MLHGGNKRTHLLAHQRQHKAVLPVRDLLLQDDIARASRAEMALPQMAHLVLVNERKKRWMYLTAHYPA